MLPTVNNRLATLLSDPFEAVRREFARDMELAAYEHAPRMGASRRYAGLSLWEEDRKICIEVDVPGMRLEDLNLTVDGGQLWIRGERKFAQHQTKRWYDERFYGAFERAVTLPDTVDPGSIEASLSDGVLTISVGKKPECQPHRVAIKYVGETDSAKRLTDG